MEKLGRNDHCWCGSGKKYKQCHEAFDEKIRHFELEGHIVPTHDMIKNPQQIAGIRESGRIFFTIGSIDYLKHGGRIGKLAGIAASALKIKPLITLKEGEIFNSGITRSRQKSMQKVVEMTEKYLDEVQAKPGEYSFCIGYGYDYEEAVGFREMLKDLIRERLGIEEIGIYQIGATIGVHTGPYPIGIGIVRHAEV